MKTIINKISNKINHVALVAAVSAATLPSFANNGSLVDVAHRGTEVFQAANSAAINFFYLTGVIVFGAGCYLIYKEQSEQGRGHAKKGAVGMLVGASLLALPTMIGLTQTSVSGSKEINGVIMNQM